MARSSRRYFCGLDLGTTKICCVIGQENEQGELLVLSRKIVPTHVPGHTGPIMRDAEVLNLPLLADLIRAAVTEAEKECPGRPRIREVAVGLAGRDVRGEFPSAYIDIHDPATGVTKKDIQRVQDKIRRALDEIPDSSIVSLIPHSYKIDNTGGIQDPLGLSGDKLTLYAHAILANPRVARNIYNCLSEAGYTPQILAAQSLASAEAVLSDKDRLQGTLIIDIGGGTSDYALYTGGSVVASGSVALGGETVTHALAQNLHIDPDDAHNLKFRYGHAILDGRYADEPISVPLLTTGQRANYTKRDVLNIVSETMRNLLEQVYLNLESSGFGPRHIKAGIKLTGGGSQIEGITDLTSAIFQRPAQVARPRPMAGFDSGIASPVYSTACGLLIMAHRGKLTTEQVNTAPDGDNALRVAWDILRRWYTQARPGEDSLPKS
jgi:cell division protein FtsA